MAATAPVSPKPQEAPLQSPMRLLDALFFLQERDKEGTPLPSKAQFLFLNGMSELGKGKLQSARPKIFEALEEAKKNPAKKEEIAICSIGVGFLYSCVPGPERDLTKTRELYTQALELLCEFLGNDCPQIAPIASDIAIVCFSQGKKDDANRFLERSRRLLEGGGHKESKGQTQEHFRRTIPQIFAQVSQAHAALGDLKHAVELLQTAVELMIKFNDPSVGTAQKVLANLEKQLAAKK